MNREQKYTAGDTVWTYKNKPSNEPESTEGEILRGDTVVVEQGGANNPPYDPVDEFLEKNVEKYKRKFKEIETNPANWNWCAFLFGGYWFLYRKMYIAFFVLLIATTLAVFGIQSIGASFAGVSESTAMILSYAVSIIITMVLPGMYGNLTYKKHMERMQRKYPNNFVSMGGVSKASVIIFIVIEFVVITAVTGYSIYLVHEYNDIMNL